MPALREVAHLHTRVKAFSALASCHGCIYLPVAIHAACFHITLYIIFPLSREVSRHRFNYYIIQYNDNRFERGWQYLSGPYVGELCSGNV